MPIQIELWLAGVLGGLIILGGTYFGGYESGINHQVKQDAATVVKVVQKQAAVTVAVGQQQETAQENTRTVTKTNIERIPIYVKSVDDSKCTIPNSFVSLWNDNLNGVSASASEPVDTPSAVDLTDTLTNESTNIGQANIYKDQVEGWIDWYYKNGGKKP